MNESTAKTVAQTIADKLGPEDRVAVQRWMEDLLRIRRSNSAQQEKIKELYCVTKNAGVIKPIAAVLLTELKRVGWDDRSWPTRLALLGVGAGLTIFSGEGAGIAAMGGAIGVPLWIVFGAGGAFAGVLIHELQRRA